MSGASRQRKLSKYEVTVRREVEYTIVVEVEARSSEEACDVAMTVVDTTETARDWREGDCTSQTAKVKVLR